MINQLSINQKLANKFYLFSCGLYGAVASVFGLLYAFESFLNLNPLILIFFAYFITVLWRSFFDQLIIYELKLKHINVKNNLILALISACVFALLYFFIRKSLGDWAIPLTIILSMKIINEIKKYIWPNSLDRLPEFLKLYSQKVQIYMWGLYAFFIAVALITYQFIKIYGTSYFYIAFAIAILIGLIAEQIYNFLVVYKIKLTALSIIFFILIALVSSIFCTTLTFFINAKNIFFR
ncbi:hypothetical protein GF322_02255 [Candidatus Dependentiae bacterium]|nr:hypothetical protein [Candidatus Dependentiae bacterium]